jgi:hypothetical protein
VERTIFFERAKVDLILISADRYASTINPYESPTPDGMTLRHGTKPQLEQAEKLVSFA